jgi:hypothetical protein
VIEEMMDVIVSSEELPDPDGLIVPVRKQITETIVTGSEKHLPFTDGPVFIRMRDRGWSKQTESESYFVPVSINNTRDAGTEN